MNPSVPTLGQPGAAVGKQLPEGLVAHHKMSGRFAGGLPFAICSREPDEMHDAIVDNDFDVSKKQCRLHGSLPAMRLPRKGQHHHRDSRAEIRNFVNCAAFVRNGFRAVSLYNPNYSRAPNPTPRDRRPAQAGMVALSVPSDMGHRSSSSVRSSAFVSNSVAGNRDSADGFQSHGFLLHGCGLLVRGKTGAVAHV